MSKSSPFTNKDSFAAAISTAFNCPDSDVETSLLNLYTRDSIIIVNQNRMSWEKFVPYIEAIRARTMSVDVECHHFIRDGNMFAERHTARGTGKDGTTTEVEAFTMGELNEEGKAIWLEEIAILGSDAEKTGEHE
ncbi:hypothetical protein MKX07_007871 [Trichoderma sp. CBMAI-0711]|uniref:SnoaL-like domain-containing protein n=1 Tax=Trichoderma parareesei TaxID=858221 RepID=A0A2H2ZQ57_TRIPA|nr:hypothetical protein MKX07_007871 [Trichoderma sp. CBMAI-0711]OTA01474.1 hypothetical protein A9Z42_0018360 [Trichoderma parareesei]